MMVNLQLKYYSTVNKCLCINVYIRENSEAVSKAVAYHTTVDGLIPSSPPGQGDTLGGGLTMRIEKRYISAEFYSNNYVSSYHFAAFTWSMLMMF